MRLDQLAKSSFIRSALVLASGTTIAQLIPFALTPVLTRVYSPDDMGVFSLYTSFVVVFLGALSLGFAYAIVSADEEDVAGLTSLCMCSIALLILPISILALLMIRLDILGFGAISPYAVLSIVLSLVITELFLILRYVTLRGGYYRDLASATVHQSFARMGAQILLGFAGLGWWGLTFGDAIGRGVGVRRLWSRTPFQVSQLVTGWSWKMFQPLTMKYRDYAKFSAPGAIIDSLSSQIVAPLLAGQFGLAVAGQYGIVLRLVILPVTLVGGSVADVFHNRLAEAAKSRAQSPVRLFLTVAAGLSLVGLLLAAAILLLNETVWSFVLGEQWRNVGNYAAAIAPRAAVLMVVSPLSRTVLVFGGQKIKLWFNVFNVLIVVGAMQMAKRLDWGAISTISAISWAQAVAGVVYFFVLWRITREGTKRVATQSPEE